MHVLSNWTFFAGGGGGAARAPPPPSLDTLTPFRYATANDV